MSNRTIAQHQASKLNLRQQAQPMTAERRAKAQTLPRLGVPATAQPSVLMGTK